MIKTTIGEVLSGRIYAKDHYIYLFRDGEEIFYVGRSYSPITRLIQHIGDDRPWIPDAIGNLILNNKPLSLNWEMELYTLEDCLPFISEAYLPYYQRYLGNILIKNELIQTAEDEMIFHFQPYLNVIGNSQNKKILPEKYQKTLFFFG